MKFSPQKERALLDGAASPVERASAIACMRSDRIMRHEDLLIGLVDHPSPHLRAEALRTLLSWDREEWIPLALERATSDEDEYPRNCLALDLGRVGHALPHHRDAVVRVLVKVVESDPDERVAGWAYGSLRYLLAHEGVVPRCPKNDFDRHRDVDWTLLDPFRSTTDR